MPLLKQSEFRGVSRLNRFALTPAYAMSAINLSSELIPALSVRPGVTRLGTAIGTRVLGLGVWQDQELHAVFSDGTWRKWTGSAWSAALASGLNATAEWTFCNFKGGLAGINLIACNGVDLMQRYDGSTVTAISGAPAGAKYVTVYADRVWCAVGNELRASAYRDATDWTTVSVPEQDTDSWYTNVETRDGEQINGISAGLTLLTITKPSSIHHLYNYAPTDFEVRPKTLDFGAHGNRAMVPLNGVLHLADARAICQYEGGVLPYRTFSAAVQAYMDEINRTAQAKTCLGTDGQRLYVSIPHASATDPSTTLVYDPKSGGWNVWTGWIPICYAQMGSDLYFGDAAGGVYKIGGTTDNGAAITWQWVTGPITAPSMAQLLRWVTLWVTAHVPTGSSMQVHLSPTDSGEDWTLIGTISPGSAVDSTTLYLSAVRAAATAKYLRLKFSGSGPVSIYEWSRDEQYLPLR